MEDGQNQESRLPSSRAFGARTVASIAVAALVLGGVVGYLAGGSGSSSGPAASSRIYDVPPSASLPPPVQLKLGQSGETETGGHVTVLSWDRGAPGWPEPKAGNEFSRAEVRFCSGPGVWNFRIREIPYLFNMVDDSGLLIPPFVDSSVAPDEFASFATGVLPPDACIMGAVIFLEPAGAKISAVRFSGHGRFEWDVSGIANGTSPAPSPTWVRGVVPSPSPAP